MINVNDIYEENGRDECIGNLPEHKGEYGTIRGPSKEGGFLVGDKNGLHVWIDAGMLDFMIEHRK